ncbi:MAG: acyl-CoA dehydrogenase, partial [Rhodococcus sp. (in: high G+C Gram-positive bacteria)]
MDFGYSARTERLLEQLRTFMEEHVYPAEAVYDEQIRANSNPHEQPKVMLDLQAKARELGLWNLFMTHAGRGAGLTNLEYAPLAEMVGRSVIGNEAVNCSAPDTGNMEILAMYGTPQQQSRWLEPLL